MEDEIPGAAEREASQRFIGVEPILAVHDVAAAAEYYKRVLAFENAWFWGNPPTHGGVNRDGVQIQFGLDTALTDSMVRCGLWLKIRNVAALYARHRETGADIVSPLEKKPWGVTEYTVRDLNGYLLRFTGSVTARPKLSPVAEAHVETRRPTWTELEGLIHAVGWDKYTNFETAPRVLQAAVCAATAVADDQAVGCAFITSDGAGFYYVRDVIVHPDWQGRGVGSALMESVIQQVRSIAPARALVGLYTGENLNDFYGRVGFRGPAHGLYGMTQVLA